MIVDASGINDAQQIAATACPDGGISGCRAVRLDLLAPVPEPQGRAMLVLGLGLAGLLARRRRARRGTPTMSCS